MEAFFSGIIAGYGIAIPVGAIAVLIIETGIRYGPRNAAAAGAGAATADLLYASLAVVGGTALAASLEPVETEFRYLSAAALAGIAVVGLRRLWNDRQAGPGTVELSVAPRPLGTYAKFLGLTIVNPLTVVYFTAFVIGLGLADGLSLSGGVAFAAGAFLASLSWQWLLAGIGTIAGHKLPDGARLATVAMGNLIVLALALVIVVR